MTAAKGKVRLTRDSALALLAGMLRIRRFEETCAELYTAEKIRGFLHLYIGEEAIAVGALDALAPDDAVVATYREHGHALARGIAMDRIMAEMYGKQSGCSRGRGGSMHIYDAATRFYGGNAIVGVGLPLAVGLALADRMQGRDAVTACFFGEGAVAEGEFHESANLAALWKLPVLFVCENNRYAMGTALDRSESQTDLHVKAASYAMGSEVVDGMDVVAVEAAARRAVDAMRSGGGPHFLECRTYRLGTSAIRTKRSRSSTGSQGAASAKATAASISAAMSASIRARSESCNRPVSRSQAVKRTTGPWVFHSSISALSR